MKSVVNGLQIIFFLTLIYVFKFLYYIVVNYWYVFCFIIVVYVILKINDKIKNSKWYRHKKVMEFRQKNPEIFLQGGVKWRFGRN